MLTRLFALVARLRWLILLGSLVLAVALGIAAEAGRLSAVIVALAAMLVALVLLGLSGRYRPATLVVARGERALVAPPVPQQVLQAVAFTMLGGLIVSDKVSDIIDREWLWYVDAALGLMFVLAVGLHWYLALGNFGLRLRPDGVVNRQLLGSLFIPWEAFASHFPVAPNGRNLAAYYARPELVRRRGFGVGRYQLPAAADPGYLAGVIQEYVHHPERRGTIGG